MQICQDHWRELKNAIRQHGLWSLVAHDGYIAAPVVSAESQGQPDSPTLDPLTSTALLISEQALMALGTYLLTCHYCPLCEVEQNLGGGLALEWIDADADAMLEVCKERHLIDNEL